MPGDEQLIELVKSIITESKESHSEWLRFFRKHPGQEQRYKRSAGDIEHHRKCVKKYNKALQALHLLLERKCKEN